VGRATEKVTKTKPHEPKQTQVRDRRDLSTIPMLEDSKRFRDRAIDCRALAKGALSADDAEMLEEIAEELDEEARKIEVERSVSG
jgi:hypothetical protein